MRPTRITFLLFLALLLAGIGWAGAYVVDARLGRYLDVPWTSPAALALLALAIALWTRSIRARLAGKEGTKPVPAIVAARTTALAMAGSRVGAFFAGFYLGVVIELLRSLDVKAARESAIAAGACVVAGVLVAIAALWLERSCQLPDPPPDPLGEHHSTPAIG